MELIDGNKIAADIIAELKTQVAALPGRPPCLALVRVGEEEPVLFNRVTFPVINKGPNMSLLLSWDLNF